MVVSNILFKAARFERFYVLYYKRLELVRFIYLLLFVLKELKISISN